MTGPSFILASSSPRRQALLADIGIKPDMIVAADIDETPKPKEYPRDAAGRLAAEKLQAVLSSITHDKAYVLAADTVVGAGRRILPKAETPQDIVRFLTLLSGRRHHVYTGIALKTPDGSIRKRTSDSIVAFRHLSRQEIDAYAQSGEGLGKAGGYAVQGQAATMIRFMSGSYSGIVGLPLFELAQLLHSSGWRL